MDTRTLVAFKTVCDAGSIGHAAEQLFISPQGLSKSMARLEAELGSPLLVRTSRGVEPTRAGQLLSTREWLWLAMPDSRCQARDTPRHGGVPRLAMSLMV